MKLSRYEQEVIICFNAAEEEASVYCAHPAWIKKMDKLNEKYPETIKLYREDEVSKEYLLPKKLIKIGKPVTLSEAQLRHLEALKGSNR